MGVGIPGPFELLILLLMGGGGGLPLGMPPAVEDPVISQVAPEECLFYTSWAAMAEPDGESDNQTEQLLAEPEVRWFAEELERRILEGIHLQMANDPEADALVDDIGHLVKTLLTSSTAIFVSDFAIERDGPTVQAGAIVNLGDQADRVERTLVKLADMAYEAENVQPSEDSDWRSLPMPEDAPPVQWNVQGSYLIVGVGSGAADAIQQRIETAPPNWLTDLRGRLAIRRTSTVTYINVAGILQRVAPIGGPMVQRVIEAVGLENVESLATVSGLDETGCLTKILLAIDGDPVGLLSLVDVEPLSQADLTAIPADASVAVAARFDLAQGFDLLLDIVGKIEPRGREEILEAMGEIEAELGFRIFDHLLNSTGDVWRIYNSPGQGGLLVTGLTGVVDVRDRRRLVPANRQLVRLVRDVYERENEGRGRPRGATIAETTFGDQTIYFLKIVGEEFPLAPAWCIAEDQLVVATFPQQVKAYLAAAAEGGPSLADLPEVARLFEADSAPMEIVYVDTREIVEMAYPFVQMGAQMICAQLQREGIDLDVSLLPSAAAVLPHLGPSVTSARRTDDGLLIESRQSLPLGGSGAAVLPALVMGTRFGFSGGMGPGLASSQARSINNLKQIALAMHNHHDVYRELPAPAIRDDDGEPLLSWRVKILPFIEQQPLYEQFHLDEPWDSPHNRALILQMPPIYRAPRSGVAAEGKTNYLGVVNEGAIFSGPDATGFRGITDGTSNTIMVVEAADDRAVTWTRPDDFEYDEEDPIAGLVGLRRGGFLAAFCDGSVRFMSEAVNAETLRNLFTRNDGNPISWDDFRQEPSRAVHSIPGLDVPVGPRR